MNADAYRIGGIEVFKTLNGTRYEEKLYVPEGELSLWMPEIGDRAAWAPEEAVITGISKTWIAPGAWMLLLTAEASENAVFSGSYERFSLDDFVEKTFSIADLYFPCEWWGIRIAGKSDTPDFNELGILAEGEKKYLNTEEEWACPGDFLFRDALPRMYGAEGNLISTESAGTADYRKSPFLESCAPPLEWAGQSIRTRVYNCSFNTRREAHKISHFAGISGSFAKSCSPGGSTENKWKALSQTVRSICSPEGKVYTNVTRSMMEAPGNLLWDPAKNGGTWSW